jgi:NitT/TauT family transport system substrate-binding protein
MMTIDLPAMKRIATVLCALGALSGLSPTSAAQEPRVVLAVDGIAEPRNLPVLVAERLHFFVDEGLIVTLVDSPASPTPGELMKDGRADGAVAYFHHTFMSQADDHLVTQAVLAMGVAPGFKLLVASRLRDRVHTLADLKGLRIYTGGPNSGKSTTANWLAARGGFTLHDYTALAPTARGEMEHALQSGDADAIVAATADAARYVASGAAFVMADLSSADGTRRALGELYPSTTLYLPKTYVSAHPEIVQHLVNAELRALAFIRSHDAETIAAALPAAKDRTAYVRLLAEEKNMFDTDGIMPAAGARDEWKAMAALQPKYAPIDFGETFTDAFVQRSPQH